MQVAGVLRDDPHEDVGVAGSEMRGDHFRYAEEARHDAGIGLANRQRHERDELIAERSQVEALAEGLEGAVFAEPPQPRVDGVTSQAQRPG